MAGRVLLIVVNEGTLDASRSGSPLLGVLSRSSRLSVGSRQAKTPPRDYCSLVTKI